MGRQTNNELSEIRKTWDWTQNNSILSRKYGVSRERVRQVRRALGLPPCTKQLRGAKNTEGFERAKELSDEIWINNSNSDIGLVLNVNHGTAGRWRKILGKKAFMGRSYREPVFAYHTVNWHDSLDQITKKLKAPKLTVCAMRRRILYKLGFTFDLRYATEEERSRAADALNNYFKT